MNRSTHFHNYGSVSVEKDLLTRTYDIALWLQVVLPVSGENGEERFRPYFTSRLWRQVRVNPFSLRKVIELFLTFCDFCFVVFGFENLIFLPMFLIDARLACVHLAVNLNRLVVSCLHE
jgi:hypothetical protein